MPFIIIAPQLQMFHQALLGIDYIDNRDINKLAKRLPKGVPSRPVNITSTQPMQAATDIIDMSKIPTVLPSGWDLVEQDLLTILTQVQHRYRVNANKTYLSGVSYGGFGTWYMASKHPTLFAAIARVVGWGHPNLMAPIAKHNIPLWGVAGGRDTAVPVEYFYPGMNELERQGHTQFRFTVHQDMGHDTWNRVYSGNDLYQWLLHHTLEPAQ